MTFSTRHCLVHGAACHAVHGAGQPPAHGVAPCMVLGAQRCPSRSARHNATCGTWCSSVHGAARRLARDAACHGALRAAGCPTCSTQRSAPSPAPGAGAQAAAAGGFLPSQQGRARAAFFPVTLSGVCNRSSAGHSRAHASGEHVGADMWVPAPTGAAGARGCTDLRGHARERVAGESGRLHTRVCVRTRVCMCSSSGCASCTCALACVP